MTNQHPGWLAPRTSRRKKTVLYGAHKSDALVRAALQRLASEGFASIAICEDGTNWIEFLEQLSDNICVVLVDLGFPDSVNALRQAAAKFPMAELVIPTTEDEKNRVEKELGTAPRLGTHWQVLAVDSPIFPRALLELLHRAEQRRSTRTTLDRFNARIALPSPSVDAREHRELIISDRFLTTLLESAFDAVILMDARGIITSFNPSAEALFGIKGEKATSHPIEALAQGSWGKDVKAILSASADTGMVERVVEIGGEQKHLEITAAPVLDHSGNRIATSLIIRDATSRALAEQAMRTTEKLTAVGRLASSIAHEINNPLDAVMNILFLARDSATDPGLRELLETADEELQRISAITTQTLRFHKQSTKPTRCTGKELFASALLVYKSRLMGRGYEFHEMHRSSARILCFDGEIRQVLNNLVGNALDAMSHGGGTLWIRTRDAVHWKTSIRGLALTVADSGSGMPVETMKKIFEAFFTTKGENGTGLGLWISAEIVLRHQGNLWVRSTQRPGRSGTVFTLFLPFEPDFSVSSNT